MAARTPPKTDPPRPPVTAPPLYGPRDPKLPLSRPESDPQLDEVAALVATQPREGSQRDTGAPLQPNVTPLPGTTKIILITHSGAAIVTQNQQDTEHQFPHITISSTPMDKSWTHAEVRTMLQDIPDPFKRPMPLHNWLLQISAIYNCLLQDRQTLLQLEYGSHWGTVHSATVFPTQPWDSAPDREHWLDIFVKEGLKNQYLAARGLWCCNPVSPKSRRIPTRLHSLFQRNLG
ncbi:hypothetical protein chiPu_0007390 [Chiloscyllium punctatum]|uniref:Uncharacterized protein n=1 Tax=Chiloscyllium punctatum TaxID=137246 RepID=A0A401SEY0_CHIPU|nr:hypothetical protein [Chiloscyllium punctatum]